MRYLFGFVFVLVALPLSAGAQAESEDSLSSWQVEAKPTPEEPALQLKLDDTGVGVVPSPWRTPDGYTLEEMERRAKRAWAGFGVSAGVYGAGVVLLLVAIGADFGEGGGWVDPALVAGGVLMGAGVVGMIATGALVRVRNRKLHRLQQAHYGTPRRVHWDLAQSRLVF
jgi:hypothetical protein